MAGVKGRSGTNKNKDKPWRDALRMEEALAEKGEPSPAKKGSLRWIARQTLERAGVETAAVREIGDRFDGKVPQALIGGEEDDPPIQITRIELVAPGGDGSG